jgi:hypothetical protein
MCKVMPALLFRKIMKPRPTIVQLSPPTVAQVQSKTLLARASGAAAWCAFERRSMCDVRRLLCELWCKTLCDVWLVAHGVWLVTFFAARRQVLTCLESCHAQCRWSPPPLRVLLLCCHTSNLPTFRLFTALFRFLLGLLGDLSSQVTSAEAAAAAARRIAEHLLHASRVIAPQHRLLQHDNLLLSSPAAAVAVNVDCELLEQGLLSDAARLARDSLAVFPIKVTCCASAALLWRLTGGVDAGSGVSFSPVRALCLVEPVLWLHVQVDIVFAEAGFAQGGGVRSAVF